MRLLASASPSPVGEFGGKQDRHCMQLALSESEAAGSRTQALGLHYSVDSVPRAHMQSCMRDVLCVAAACIVLDAA